MPIRQGGNLALSSTKVARLTFGRIETSFKRDAATLTIRDAFDLALAASDPAKLEVDYFKNFTACR